MTTVHVFFLLLVLSGYTVGKTAKKKSETKTKTKTKTTETTTTTLEVTATALYEHETRVVSLVELPCSADTVVTVKSVKSNTRNRPQCGICFQVYPTVSDTHELRFLPLDSVDYDRDQSYTVKVDCRDQYNVILLLVNVLVRIEPNIPPFFSVSHMKESSSVRQLTNTGLSVAFCTDDDDINGDTVTYTLQAMDPVSSFFTLTDAGLLQATSDLAGECQDVFIFTIFCTDRFQHTAATPLTLELTLTDSNKQPVVSGLNQVRDVAEDTASGDSLASVTVQEAGAVPVCVMSALPAQSLDLFQLEMAGAQGHINVKGRLDYEQPQTRNTNLTVTCSDGSCTSAMAYLYVRITDVKEPVMLLPRNLTISTYEGMISVDPEWAVIDEDDNDDPTYTIVGGNSNGRFTIHPTTGIITSTLEYDVDQGAMPDTDVLVVQVTDEGGHSSSSTVTLTILDLNDNNPVFSADVQSGAAQSFVHTITNCSDNIGVTIGTVVATDADSSFQGNNVLTYSVTSGPITVDVAGNVIVDSDVTAGMTYTVQVSATDSGQVPGPLTSVSPVTITVIVTACPPASITALRGMPVNNTTPNSKSSLKENLGWIVLAVLLAMVWLSLLGLVVWRGCRAAYSAGKLPLVCGDVLGDCCQPLQTPRKIRPAAIGPQWNNGNRLFWDERYPCDDYQSRVQYPCAVHGYGRFAGMPWRVRAIEF